MIVRAEDGSNTLFSEKYNQTYHSTCGAVLESEYIYIENGFQFIPSKSIRILEYGFGTGLNAILTHKAAQRSPDMKVFYESLEKYPLSEQDYLDLDYGQYSPDAMRIQMAEWDVPVEISPGFTLLKRKCDFLEFQPERGIDLVYFDAFSPDAQPELWSENQFRKTFEAMNPEAVLVTYSSKGIVKQGLRNAGFEVHRLKGAGFKRHMVRATKHQQL